MGFLEKAIGVSKGLLTNLETKNATATEIRRSTIDTFVLIDNIQQRLEVSINQLVYAYNVIANVNNLSQQGEYEVIFDWSYSLLEDNSESFNQKMQGLASGLLKPEEVRAWLMNEDIETAKKNLPEIEQLVKAE